MTRFTGGGILLLGGVALMMLACLSLCGVLELVGLRDYAEFMEEEFPITEAGTTTFATVAVLAPCIVGVVIIGAGAGIAYWGASSRAKQGQPIRDRDWIAMVLLAVGTVGLCACSPLSLPMVLGLALAPVPSEEAASSGVLALMFLLPLFIAAGALIGGMAILLFGRRRAAGLGQRTDGQAR